MYIATKFYDDGKAMAKLYEGFGDPILTEEDISKCDLYIEAINPQDDQPDTEYNYESLEDWANQMLIKTNDIPDLIDNLNNGDWVDISKYC